MKRMLSCCDVVFMKYNSLLLSLDCIMPPQNNDDPPSRAIPSNAITQLPTSFKPRRRRNGGLQHGALRRPNGMNGRGRTQTTTNEDDDDSINDDDLAVAALSSLTDTHIAIQTLRSQWPDEARNRISRTPPIILRSQIHALVADGTKIEREINALITQGIIYQIRIPTSSADSSSSSTELRRRYAYIMVEDLRLLFPNHNQLFQRFFDRVLPRSRHGLVHWHVLEEQLYALKNVQNKDIQEIVDELVRAQFLTLVDEHTFSLAVPGMGVFVQNRSAGEKQIIRLLKTTQYREMPLPKLELRSLKQSIFTAQWHVRDIVGSGIAHTVPTSVGTLVRLTHSR